MLCCPSYHHILPVLTMPSHSTVSIDVLCHLIRLASGFIKQTLYHIVCCEKICM